MNAYLPEYASSRHRQGGAVLVVALLFLMIITMLGITSLQSTTSEERMAGNTRDWNTALQAAEAALRDAFYDINGVCMPNIVGGCTPRATAITGTSNFGDASSTPGTCSTLGLCMPTGTKPNFTLLNISNWSSSGANAVYPVTYGTYTQGTGSSGSAIPNVATQPQYIIEGMCLPDSTSSLSGIGCPRYIYRITARGYGGNSNTQVTLQSTVRL